MAAIPSSLKSSHDLMLWLEFESSCHLFYRWQYEIAKFEIANKYSNILHDFSSFFFEKLFNFKIFNLWNWQKFFRHCLKRNWKILWNSKTRSYYSELEHKSFRHKMMTCYKISLRLKSSTLPLSWKLSRASGVDSRRLKLHRQTWECLSDQPFKFIKLTSTGYSHSRLSTPDDVSTAAIAPTHFAVLSNVSGNEVFSAFFIRHAYA